jgi:8-oxo-dGTP pyrophosphatase MutT (NUDIX family)
MQPKSIRPIAICLFRRGDRILVAKAYDSVKQDAFYRPLGGGIEFGESSHEAIQREIQEELGVEIQNIVLLTVLENQFQYEGQPGHEIVFVFDAEFVEAELYDRPQLEGYESNQTKFIAQWHTPEQIQVLNGRLVPTGLGEFLSQCDRP